ncbi:MAG: type II toxin-antitoxin system VapC family toxin [Gemmatimonadota bacterium]
MILETTFLIDLERELRRGEAGPAQAFLERHADAPLRVTFTIAGELAAGVSPRDRARWEEFLQPFEVLSSSAEVCWQYGQAYRFLKANGLLVGTNDLWIAATALASDEPLVTRNTREYGRIPGLTVLGYNIR